MNLDETFQLLALQIPVDPDALMKFAAEDRIGGWDLDKGGWPIGSLWSVEGKVLYALVRLLQPELVVEIGTHRGCSTTHIATALDINGKGLVVTLDTAPGVGDMIPSTLNKRVNKVAAEGIVWLQEQPDESIDIIYEDADHSAETCANIAKLATAKLKPGGLLITHDAAHDFAWYPDGNQSPSDVGATIRRGLEMALGNQFRTYRTDPSDCGFALWQKPLQPMQTDVHSTPAEKPKNDFVTSDGEHLKVVQDDAMPPALAQSMERMKARFPASDETRAYEEERGVKETAAVEDEDAAKELPLGEMTVAQLKEYAANNDIDIAGIRTKAEILDRISVH